MNAIVVHPPPIISNSIRLRNNCSHPIDLSIFLFFLNRLAETERRVRPMDVWLGMRTPDRRGRSSTIEHDLVEALLAAACAVLSEADTLTFLEIEAWAKEKPDWRRRQRSSPQRETAGQRNSPPPPPQTRSPVARSNLLKPGAQGTRESNFFE